MKKNVGKIDKSVRILVAIVIMALYYFGYISGTIAMVLLVVGAIFLLTSLLNICPLYSIFGINTCKRKQNFKLVYEI